MFSLIDNLDHIIYIVEEDGEEIEIGTLTRDNIDSITISVLGRKTSELGSSKNKFTKKFTKLVEFYEEVKNDIKEDKEDTSQIIEDNLNTEVVDSDFVKEYYFEPNVSIIEGTLITRLHYGPPRYGEDPDNDEKEYPFILLLDDSIKVIAEDTDMINSSISDVSEIQLVLKGSPCVDMAKQYKNKHIKVQGTLFSAFSGHHHTEVLIVVDKILD